MFQIDSYISKLIELLKINFDKRLIYVGLQGSYLRGEANQNSDIDIMVVIDGLSVSDLAMYRSVIESLGDSDRSCGFICSKADLKNWNPLEIWNLTNGTKDYYGSLHLLVPAYSERDIRIFTKLSVNNLYHEMCHRYIHGDHDRTVFILPQLYKGTFFILQSLYYIAHGRYVATKAELLHLLDGKDFSVMQRCVDLYNGIEYDFNDNFSLLFTWCQETMQTLES